MQVENHGRVAEQRGVPADGGHRIVRLTTILTGTMLLRSAHRMVTIRAGPLSLGSKKTCCAVRQFVHSIPTNSIHPKRLRVIIADDHPSVLNALLRILEPACDVVSMAVDGEDLLRQVRDVSPDVVVTDIAMPNMNGLDACRHIRATYPNISVVIVSGLLDEDLAAAALEMGATAVLDKLDMARLLPTVMAIRRRPLTA